MKAIEHMNYVDEKNRLEHTLKLIRCGIDKKTNEKITTGDEYVKAHLEYLKAKEIEKLKKAEDKPYFGRIDFKAHASDTKEHLYIGKKLVMNEDNSKSLVVDWRAPIASLYYDGNMGEVNYECLEGSINGKLSLKRSYKIDEQELQDISDTDIATNDEALIKCLEENKDDKLKDIVATIQSEQNKIIRADMKTPLIVQGVAGSGKTTIALHRIAYLAYTYQNKCQPENFMIIAPNKLFLNYIANVLPDLGVDDVNQITFEELALQVINEKIKIKDSDMKLSDIIEKDEKEAEDIKQVSKLKSSMQYKNAMDAYVKVINKSLIPNKDFEFEGIEMFEKNQIEKLFNEDYSKYHSSYRIEEIRKYILNKFSIYEEKIRNTMDDIARKKVDELKENMPNTPERQKLIIEIIDSKQEKSKKLKNIYKKSVNEYLPGPSKSIIKYYTEFIKNEKIYKKCINGDGGLNMEEIEKCREYTKTVLDNKEIEMEDLAAVLYLKNKIHGIDKVKNMKQVVVDEAQDIGTFQFYTLKEIMKEASFTILGDIAQGINDHRGTSNWNDIKDIVFQGDCNILNLQQSYRTTTEIMEAANTVINKIDDPNIILAKPVLRHGENVKIIEKKNSKDMIEDISGKIEQLKEKFKSIAIICKSMGNCKEVHSKLNKNDKNIKLIKNKEEYYNGGVVVVPSYLSKGLEFDSVIIPDADKNNYKQNNLDKKLLYVSMTRALHNLDIYHNGEKSELVNNINKSEDDSLEIK